MSNAVEIFEVEQRVIVTTSSYCAAGSVRSSFLTRAGHLRYVVEFDVPAGLLHIVNGAQLSREERV